MPVTLRYSPTTDEHT